MKVILLKDIVNVGDENTVVNVSDGYARNYLFPKKLAISATPAALAVLDRNKTRIEKKIDEKKEVLKKIAKELEGITLEITADAGEQGKLFGSITTHDIAVALKEKTKHEIDRKKILLAEHIKAAGEYEATVKLFSDIEVVIKINVIGHVKAAK